MTYKVQFMNIDTGKGFIDGYQTARRAKEVVEMVNAKTEAARVAATYLGKERAA